MYVFEGENIERASRPTGGQTYCADEFEGILIFKAKLYLIKEFERS